MPSGFLLFTVEEHAVDANDDKRNTEPLAHVKRHAVFKAYLVFLQELDEEAEEEDFRQAESEEETAAGCGAVLRLSVEVNHAEEEDEVGHRFVELCRMARNHVDPLEYECPGHAGGIADDFRVHQIGQTDAAGGDGGGYGNHVEHVHVVHLRLAAVEPQGDDESQRTAVAGQAFVARKLPSAVRQELHGENHFPEVVQVVVGLVEQAMTQAGADEDTEEAVEEQRFELVVADAPVAVFFLHDEVGKSQADDPQQAIVTDGDAEEVEQFGIGVPVDVE